MGFSQALSGLGAAATNLDVIGNNIANSQTVGFKSSRAQFADIFAGAQVGLGTRVSTVMQDFSSGTLESTGRNMDLAIDGAGFFRLIQSDQVVYSRNGQFNIDADGYIVNAQGARLTGFPAGDGAGGSAEVLRVPTAALQAQASTEIESTLNLDARVDNALGAFDPTDPDTYSYANNVTLFDSQGKALNTTMYFSKVGVNSWEVNLVNNGVVATLTPPATNALAFDTNGVITGADELGPFTFPFDPAVDGVDPVDVSLNLRGTTQFGSDFDLKDIAQNGYTSGSLVGVTIDKSGSIIGNYSNEEARSLGMIAMANFNNPEGLRPVGDNAWVESTASGQPLVGMAGVGQFGRIEAGVVENSNVELTRQLVDLIIAQRNYQANAQTIKVQDEVLQNAVNLR